MSNVPFTDLVWPPFLDDFIVLLIIFFLFWYEP
jgi:hypothetical protein